MLVIRVSLCMAILLSIFGCAYEQTREDKSALEIEVSDEGASIVINAWSATVRPNWGIRDLYIVPPGLEPILLSDIDGNLIESGDDDPIFRHKALVLSALNSGDMAQTRQEKDEDGHFLVWITGNFDDRCHLYSTLLDRHNGTSLLAWRWACKTESGWRSGLQDGMDAMAALARNDINSSVFDNMDEPHLQAIPKIETCLEKNMHRGLFKSLTAIELINNCFVAGELTDANFHAAQDGSRSISSLIAMTIHDGSAIADWGYALDQSGDSVGSQLFYEAMALLTQNVAYFHEMVGAAKIVNGDMDGALSALDHSLSIDPLSGRALVNRAFVLMRMGRFKDAQPDLLKVVEGDANTDSTLTLRARQLLDVIDSEIS